MCKCEFSNVGHHDPDCLLYIPLIRRLEAAKERVIVACDFDTAAAIRDAIIELRKYGGAASYARQKLDEQRDRP